MRRLAFAMLLLVGCAAPSPEIQRLQTTPDDADPPVATAPGTAAVGSVDPKGIDDARRALRSRGIEPTIDASGRIVVPTDRQEEAMVAILEDSRYRKYRFETEAETRARSR